MVARLTSEDGASGGASRLISSASKAKSFAAVRRANPFSPIFLRVMSSNSTKPGEAGGHHNLLQYAMSRRLRPNLHRSTIYGGCSSRTLQSNYSNMDSALIPSLSTGAEAYCHTIDHSVHIWNLRSNRLRRRTDAPTTSLTVRLTCVLCSQARR